MRSNKEKKKPKAEWNKRKKSGPALSPFALAREQIQPGQKHGFRGEAAGRYLSDRMYDFFKRNLLIRN